MTSPQNYKILFLGTYEDEPYLVKLKSPLSGHQVSISLSPISTLIEVTHACKKKGISIVISTSKTLLEKLTGGRKVSIDNFAGSLISKDGIEFLFINPLEHLVTVPYGKFLLTRYLSKVINKSSWARPQKFDWKLLDESNWEKYFQEFSHAFAIAVDIETVKTNLAIRCIGYTGIFISPSGDLTLKSLVLPINSMFHVEIMRKFNWEIRAPKIFQNGKYDLAYLFRYDALPYAYYWDTATMFHAWYSELPKDLASLGAFFVREIQYWKDLADTSDLHQFYEYNARDTWTTAQVFIQWMLQTPDWARNNYLMEFPLNYPAHMCEMRGIKRDIGKLIETRKKLDSELMNENISLDKLFGTKGFNVSSPKQMKTLLTVLGVKDISSADEKALKKAAFLHPLNNLIIDKILEIRKKRKLISTYLKTGEDAEEFKDRVLFALNPHGTDTGRQASKTHHFWCGLQIQNIPRGKVVKQTLIADPGFRFAEVDLSQAETRDTAYASGDANLIAAVESPKDFHTINLCSFFGRKYEDVWDEEKKKTKDKTLRDLAKRVNHGANYNMGPNVLVDTMGLKAIYQSAKILNLPKHFTPKQIAEYLLSKFHETYPSISRVYYPGIIKDVVTSQKLVGATGWTRYCFGRPDQNKQALNAYAAHVAQSLNAMILNKAFLKIFYEIALNPKYAPHFKLIAQIHDSILFQFREGHEYLCQEVKSRMEIPVKIKGYDGQVREFTVPADIKAGKDGRGAKYWADTE